MLTSGPTAATRLRLVAVAGHLLLVITHHAQVGLLAHALADTPLQSVGVAGRDMRVALLGVEFETIQRRHGPAFCLVNIPGGSGGLHERPKAGAGARGTGITRGRVHPAADREVKLFDVPRKRAFGKKISDAKVAVVERASWRL